MSALGRSGAAPKAAADPEEAGARPSNPEDFANPLSRLLFVWVGALLRKGFNASREKGGLDEDDLWPVAMQDVSKLHFERFEQHFQEAWKQPQQQGRLYRALKAQFGSTFLCGSVLKVINDWLQFVAPLLLYALLDVLEKGDADGNGGLRDGKILAVLIFVSMAIKTVLENNYFHIMFRLGMHLQAALILKVYSKALRLTAASRQSRTIGEIVNYMQLDVMKIRMYVEMAAQVIWSGIHQILGCVILLYLMIGPATFVGLGVMVITLPLQGYLQTKIRAYRDRINHATDRRVKVTNEILQGIRSLKMYGWEESFLEYVNLIRQGELVELKNRAAITALNTAVFIAAPAFVAAVSFATYSVLHDGPMEAARVFTALTLYSFLRLPLMFYPMALQMYEAAKLSMKRLEDFFSLEEVDTAYFLEAPKSGQMIVSNGTFSWEVDGEDNESSVVLRDVNITVEPGELFAVVGRVGSGKSSLCAALLGELKKVSGDVHTSGTRAYVAQTAWILNATIRDNIIFGKPYDAARYQKVLDVCELRHDLELMPSGDQTEIGERGINLSGGQKQRVSIARAVYNDADIYLFDDPLSALDPEIAKRIFENCIKGLLKNKTRLLVTNQLHFMPEVDRIAVLSDTRKGEICQVGTFQELMAADGSQFQLLMHDFGMKTEEAEADEDGENGDGNGNDGIEEGKADSVARARSRTRSKVHSKQTTAGEKQQNAAAVAAGKMIEKEGRERGAVDNTVYMAYLRSANSVNAFMVTMLLAVLQQIAAAGQSYWAAYWSDTTTDDKEDCGKHDDCDETHPNWFYLVIYTTFAVAIAIFTGIRTYMMFVIGLKSSSNLHLRLLGSVLAAPLSWFDVTPTGRIVNRFSQDVYTMDESLPHQWSMFINTIMSVVFVMLSMIFVMYWFLFVLIPVSLAYVSLMNYFRTTQRELKRLESVTRSPIFAHFSQTLGGLSTIRGYVQQERFMIQTEQLIDSYHEAYFAMKSADRWLSMHLEMLGNLLVFANALLIVMLPSMVSPGAAGFSLSAAMSTTGLLNWMVRSAAETEAMMNSVERILQFADDIPQEKQVISGADPVENVSGSSALSLAPRRADENWPSAGQIVFDNFQLRYRPGLDLALKGISCTIEPNEKIGVVGRTGSGKSSTLLGLLRLVEAAGGRIIIDGIDISTVELRTLRRRISIIPQESVLFSGSFRHNLDPFEEHTDETLWAALEKVGLAPIIRGMDGHLETNVAEYGENFSHGQRQLVCLARALLRKCKILLLDEATASVDFQTDKLMQTTIRQEFKDCTIVTVAHRLNTIIDSNRILVLADGKVVEFDTPVALLDREGSVFHSLVQEMGPAAFDALYRIAKEGSFRGSLMLLPEDAADSSTPSSS